MTTNEDPLAAVRRDEEGAARVRRVVELDIEEADTDHPGRDLILEHLVQALLVEALRFRSASVPREEQGLFAGLGDPALVRALREIHADAARNWSVAELARTAFMSRAVLAERFTRKVGMPPMQHVLEWRMAIAKDRLRRDGYSLAEVAHWVGYQSAAACDAAFTRLSDCPPSVFARSTA